MWWLTVKSGGDSGAVRQVSVIGAEFGSPSSTAGRHRPVMGLCQATKLATAYPPRGAAPGGQRVPGGGTATTGRQSGPVAMPPTQYFMRIVMHGPLILRREEDLCTVARCPTLILFAKIGFVPPKSRLGSFRQNRNCATVSESCAGEQKSGGEPFLDLKARTGALADQRSLD